MPHVIVKLYPGRTEQQKAELAERIARDVREVMQSSDASISVSIEDVSADEWAEKVYRPEIAGKAKSLYKKPGYTM